jgi:3'-phosphoadenosine 5'-phosphosulfate sulfotransferase (PAPS reductase)/FAD synthetase
MRRIELGTWASLKPHFEPPAGAPCIAGISGGSTSAVMAALLPASVLLCFQNTGREALRTYDFLGELEEALGRPIVLLEYRKPPTKGGRPCEAGFEVVTHKTLHLDGEPFEMLMEALNAFRAKNGKGKIAPWWRSRICTTYMKTRNARNYVTRQLGWTKWTEAVGLRADEPARVAKLRVGHPRHVGRWAPLNSANIMKGDVVRFWDEQSFKLDLPEYMGNCTGCFLKDQSDIARASLHAETDWRWWRDMELRWPGWGGRGFEGYDRLAKEGPNRLAIEVALRAGEEPANDGTMTRERFRLVVIQERKRIAKQTAPFSCGCEGSTILANLEPEEEDDYILNLPSEDEEPKACAV